MVMEKQRILTVGGGSGQFTLLSGLRSASSAQITAVVSMVDSGGSSGRLREEYGTLPPCDVLKCILALSPDCDYAEKILLKKFRTNEKLRGHNAGNMLLTMLSRYSGEWPAAIETLSEILNVQGRILPVTLDKATLVAELTDGNQIYGENAIDIPYRKVRSEIRSIFLVPHHKARISAYPPVIEAISDADYIIIGPGDLYTSIMPSLVVPGIKEAIQRAKASIFYVINIMTKFGETQNYSGFDFIQKIEACIERKIDAAIYNTRRPPREILEKYRLHNSEFVRNDPSIGWRQDRTLFASDLLSIEGGKIWHHPDKLAMAASQLISRSTCFKMDKQRQAHESGRGQACL